MFVKQTEIPPEEKEQLYESKSIKTILVYKAVYLFGVEEMASLQRREKVLALGKTLAGIVCAVKDKQVLCCQR